MCAGELVLNGAETWLVSVGHFVAVCVLGNHSPNGFLHFAALLDTFIII